MLRFLLLCGLGLLASAHLTAAQAVSSDTLPGHRQLVRSLSAALCTELSSSQAPNLAAMPSADVLPYAQGLFTKVMRRDSARVVALFEAAAARGIQPTAAAQLVGRDAMLSVAKTCPAARPLALRLSQTEQGQRAIAAQQPKLPLAERNALLPVAHDLCAALSASNARTPLSSLTAAGRKQVVVRAIQKAFKPHTAALNRFYGPAKLDALLRNGEFDGRVASLMISQHLCTEYLILVGSDRLNEPGARP